MFGAGPIGLGAVLGLRRRASSHVVVIDIMPSRLEKALEIGADAVINSAEEDVAARLVELHGDRRHAVMDRGVRPGTDVYLDAAGVAGRADRPSTRLAKQGATLGDRRGAQEAGRARLRQHPHQRAQPSSWSMGYPTEIFEVTDDIIANWEKYQLIVSDRFAVDDVLRALEVAATPGAADKVMVTLD